jgi:recombinational DNA repair protein RecT
MAKDFTRSKTQSSPIQGGPSAGSNGSARQAQPTPQQPAGRNWVPQNNSFAPPPRDREAEIVEALRKPEFVAAIAQILKDRNEATLDAEEFIRHAVNQVQSRELDAHEKLVQCTPASVQTAVKRLAAMGLSPNAEQGEGWLVPRWSKHANTYIASPVPGVRGMERKLMETGKVAIIESRAIYLQDPCKIILGTENRIEHEVNLVPDPERPNPIVGSYGIVALKDGRKEIAVKRLYPPKVQKPQQETEQKQQQEKSRAYMDEETNARYLAQRPAMKGALNKFFKEDRGLQSLLEMENESYESAINREPGDIKITVNPNGNTIDIPLAQVGSMAEQQIPSADKNTKAQTLADRARQLIENQQIETNPDVERGVRV